MRQESNSRPSRGQQSDTFSQAPTTSHSNNFNSSSQFSSKTQGLNTDSRTVQLMDPHQKKRLSEFLDRFQGKVSQIQKDGHIGVVARTGKPIEKILQEEPIIQQNDINNQTDNENRKVNRDKSSKYILRAKVKMIKQKDNLEQSKTQHSEQNKQATSSDVNKQASQKEKTIQNSDAYQNNQKQTVQKQLDRLKIQQVSNPPSNFTSIQASAIQSKQEQRAIPNRQAPPMPEPYYQPSFQQQPIQNSHFQTISYHHPHQNFSVQYQSQPVTAIHHIAPNQGMAFMKQQQMTQMPQPQMSSNQLYYQNQPYDSYQIQPKFVNHTFHNQQSDPIFNSLMNNPQSDVNKRYRSNSFFSQTQTLQNSNGPYLTLNQASMGMGGQRMNGMEKQVWTPKSVASRKSENLTFTGIGNSIMRNTDYPVISNKKLFSKSGGLGPSNIGSDEWVRAKEKQERVQHFLRQIKFMDDYKQ